MAKAQGLSEATVRRIWHQHRLKPHLVETFKLSRDKQFIEKLYDVVGLYLNPPDKALVLCVDEKSQIQALDRTQPMLPLRPGIPARQTHDYKRNGTTTLFAALSMLDGKVIGDCMPRHRHQEFIRFLKRIDEQTPHDQDLHLIVDNYGTHKHPRVASWLKRHPRFHLHFIPTSSSWLNLVERWFREITDKRIRRGSFKNVPDLISAITQYIDGHNQNPQIFVWNASVEKIMAKITKCKEALDALHYLVYLQQTVWPAGLSVLYPRPEFHAVRLVVAAMILLGLSAAAWQVRLHRPGVLSGWVWFLVMLVPSIGFFWMGTTEGAGDRFSYLPAMGLMLAVVCALPRFGRGRCLWIVAGSVSVLGAGVATLRQLPIWQHSGTLFGRVLEVMPDHFQANLNRGIWLAEAGRAAEAQEHYRRAWEVSARNRPEVMGKAAYDWALAGQASRALDLLAPARYDVRATPLIHAAAGMACLHAGHLPDAIWHLNQALALEPGTEEYRVELVRACFESGAEDKAREHAARLMTWPGRPIRTADDLYPFYLQRWRDGARPYAWEYFRRLIEAQPDCIPLLNNLAWLAATDGDAPPDALADAEEYARRAVGLAGEQNAAVQDTWAAVLAARGDFDAAVKTAARARHAAEAQGQAQLARRIDARLATYHRQQPWRE